MGISLEQYRVSIGLYHKCISSSKELFKVYFTLVFLLQAFFKLCKFFVKFCSLTNSLLILPDEISNKMLKAVAKRISIPLNILFNRSFMYKSVNGIVPPYISEFHPLNVNTILFGGDGLSYEDNIRIFSAVQLFIKDIKRFAN